MLQALRLLLASAKKSKLKQWKKPNEIIKRITMDDLKNLTTAKLQLLLLIKMTNSIWLLFWSLPICLYPYSIYQTVISFTETFFVLLCAGPLVFSLFCVTKYSDFFCVTKHHWASGPKNYDFKLFYEKTINFQDKKWQETYVHIILHFTDNELQNSNNKLKYLSNGMTGFFFVYSIFSVLYMCLLIQLN